MYNCTINLLTYTEPLFNAIDLSDQTQQPYC